MNSESTCAPFAPSNLRTELPVPGISTRTGIVGKSIPDGNSRSKRGRTYKLFCQGAGLNSNTASTATLVLKKTDSSPGVTIRQLRRQFTAPLPSIVDRSIERELVRASVVRDGQNASLASMLPALDHGSGFRMLDWLRKTNQDFTFAANGEINAIPGLHGCTQLRCTSDQSLGGKLPR